MWVRGYTPYEERYSEPPVIIGQLQTWLDENNSRLMDGLGQLFFEFPNEETALKFKKEWHDTAIKRYPRTEMLRKFKK